MAARTLAQPLGRGTDHLDTDAALTPVDGLADLGLLDLDPLPPLVDLLEQATERVGAAVFDGDGVAVIPTAAKPNRAEQLCGHHAKYTAQITPVEAAPSKFKTRLGREVMFCHSLRHPRCGAGRLVPRARLIRQWLAAQPVVAVTVDPYARRKAANQAERRAGAAGWHLALGRPGITPTSSNNSDSDVTELATGAQRSQFGDIDYSSEWETDDDTRGRAVPADLLVTFADRHIPRRRRPTAQATVTGSDAAVLFDILCVIPYVAKLPRSFGMPPEPEPKPEPMSAAMRAFDPTDDVDEFAGRLEALRQALEALRQAVAGAPAATPPPAPRRSVIAPEAFDLDERIAQLGMRDGGWSAEQAEQAGHGWCPDDVAEDTWWRLVVRAATQARAEARAHAQTRRPVTPTEALTSVD